MLCSECQSLAALQHLRVKIWELLGKKQYSCVFFWQKGVIWPPGVVIYRDTSYCFVTYFEETLPRFILKCYVAILSNQNVQNEKLLKNSNILGIFGSKYWYLTPCGSQMERYSLTFGDSFWRSTIMLCCECNSVAAFYHLRVEICE